MTFQVKHLKRLRRRLLAAGLFLALLPATGRCDPDAQAILRDARMAQAGQHRIFHGHLRVQATGAIIPFMLSMDGNDIEYRFQEGSSILLRLSESGAQLMEDSGGNLHKFSPSKGDTPVQGTDLTYEDVSLRFLYWKKAKIDGSETIDAQNCWKLHLEPGDESSPYAVMLLWVSKRTGAFLQGEGYDRAGKLVKRFKAISAQRDPAGGWMLKQMRIQTLVPGGKTTATYLEIEKEK